jgi:hypothetical protein
VIEHVPRPASVNVDPFTVQTLEVVEAKLTTRPEVAEALRVTGPGSEILPGFAKLMVCEAWLTVKTCVTGVATPYVAFPN